MHFKKIAPSPKQCLSALAQSQLAAWTCCGAGALKLRTWSKKAPVFSAFFWQNQLFIEN
jgi:hypothetical protein